MMTPEQRLFQAVVLQAFRDAVRQLPRGLDLSRKQEIKVARAQARAWLLEFSQDFRTVCTWADMCPEVIRERARALKRNGWAIFRYDKRMKFIEAA